ncbi:MAG: response regulator transcription factor [Candidatus Accumulibacter sp.]|uniref:helix-turn-helix domain-containing protein n=1 Tax=Accumulibacter sp. TaxID=2053492 RepID=UPI00287AF8CA|nr:response regulator transcription factor [Accumulibacter sp.]MDS4014672.1 response regulator transcription factor [Accumulibacter sp.]
MQQIFLCADARPRSSWREAFPGLIAARLDSVPAGGDVVWALLPVGQPLDTLLTRVRQGLAGRPLIVLADEPDTDGALAALAGGASGYCNGHAAASVLQQVAAVVQNGGLWIGTALMKRLLNTTAALLARRPGEKSAWRAKLTAREQEVALAVAAGASNKEIARDLEISERTVKFHVSGVLDKLGARDRLQLSLIVNGVPEQV